MKMFRRFMLATVAAAGIGAGLIGTAAPAAAWHWGHGYGYGHGGPRHYGPPHRPHGWGGPGWRQGYHGHRHWARPVPPWHRPMHPYGPHAGKGVPEGTPTRAALPDSGRVLFC
jgi:hypothetical protein